MNICEQTISHNIRTGIGECLSAMTCGDISSHPTAGIHVHIRHICKDEHLKTKKK